MRYARYTLITLACIIVNCAILLMADDVESIAPEVDLSSLSDGERDLLTQCFEAHAQLRSAYESLRMVVRDTTWRAEKGRAADSEVSNLVLDVDRSLEVTRLGREHYLVTGSRINGDGRTSAGAFLINHDMAWNLKRDQKTEKYFITTHGKDRFTSEHNRYEEWWVDAASSFYIKSLERIFATSRGARVTEVTELTDEQGERLIKIELLYPRSHKVPDALNAPAAPSFLEFYRDQDYALKTATAFSYSIYSSTKIEQNRIVQQCSYKPFQDGEPPRLASVVLEQFDRTPVDRDFSDQTGWNLVQRQRVDVTHLSLTAPDVSEFQIERFIDTAANRNVVGKPIIKWFFFANGSVLLALWYFLRRRKQTVTPANSN